MTECRRKVVTICSSIPRLHHHVQRVCDPSFSIINIDPPATLDTSICQKTDYLISDGGFFVSLLGLKDFGRLKFVQNTWAGVDGLAKKVTEDGLSPRLRVARHQHPKFGKIMAEYSLAAVINMERSMANMLRNQINCDWNKRQTHPNIRVKMMLILLLGSEAVGYRCLNELKVGVLGMGHMGQSIAKVFSELGCDVVGLVSSPRGPTQHVSRHFTTEELGEMLAGQDYLINVLPATPETDKLLNRENLKHCRDVVFINIGRGNIISEANILFALDNNFFRGAVLDVFDVEPLPKDSPLWAQKNITITPHVAGESRAEDVAECFKQNLDQDLAGKEPEGLVDWNKLY